MKKQTTKKMRIVGTESYTNSKTGEIKEMQVIEMQDRDFNFEKIWIAHILESLEAVGNKKIKVLNTLLAMKNRDNQIIATQRIIGERAKVSVPVVNETIKILMASDFLIKQAAGVYMINPDVIFKGGMSNRMNVLIEYKKEKETKISDDPETYLLE